MRARVKHGMVRCPKALANRFAFWDHLIVEATGVKAMTTSMRAAAMVGIGMALTAGMAYALPRAGSQAPVARAETVDGKVLEPRALGGKVALIFYEDKDSAKDNKALKDAITQQGKTVGHKDNAVIFAVADVSAYDYWPARGFVKDAIREEEKKTGTSIYLDWNGSFGKAFGFQTGSSNLVLLGPDNKVKLAHVGIVPPALRATILGELRK